MLDSPLFSSSTVSFIFSIIGSVIKKVPLSIGYFGIENTVKGTGRQLYGDRYDLILGGGHTMPYIVMHHRYVHLKLL